MFSDCVIRPLFWCKAGYLLAYLRVFHYLEYLAGYNELHATEGDCDATEEQVTELWRETLEVIADVTGFIGITWAIYPAGASDYVIEECGTPEP